MPKTPSSKLFQLIKSLSGSEKRYFKLFISRKEKGSSKYARLFDAIDEQEIFNDDALRDKVYLGEPVETRKYSELKAYLYDLILKSLQSFDEKSSIDYKLKNMLLGVRTLFKRSHFEDCKVLLKKAKRLAREYEGFNMLIEILSWEKQIAYTQMNIGFLDQELKRITEEEEKYISQLTNISSYKSIFFKLFVSIRKDATRSEALVKDRKLLMKTPLMAHEEKALSFKAKLIYFRIKSIFYFSISEINDFYLSSKKLIELIEQNKIMLKEDVTEYISTLSNHIVSCGKLGKYDEVSQTLDKLANIKPITLDDSVKIHRQYYTNKFRLCINTGDFDEGKKALEKHLKEIKKYDTDVFNKSDFYFQYFCIYFGCQDYENALNCLNNWMNIVGGADRKGLQSLARILNLIVHHELGNTVLLESLLRSTYRFLNKENRLSEIERKLMNFIRESSKPQSKRETKQALENLMNEFEGLSDLPSKNILNMFDIQAWLESKLRRISFAEVLREKFLKTI